MKHGEIITLGRHRLMCGDATNRGDVMKLLDGAKIQMLFTSPPYSDIYNYSGNDLSVLTLKKFIPAAKDFCEIICVNLGIKRKDYEIVTYWDEYINEAKEAGLKLLAWNVWDKLSPGSISQQQMMFPLRHEFIFVFGKKPYHLNHTVKKKYKDRTREKSQVREKDGTLRFTTSGARNFDEYKPLESVIALNSYKKRPVIHPAMMPETLPQEYILAATQENNNILDCFGGSGTTLIACEITNRNCFMMEISPEYCEIIRERYEKLKEAAPLFS